MTTTSILLFRKKSSRTITFDEFKVALGELARKKYKEKSGEEAEAEVFKLIEGKAPVIAGVTVRFERFKRFASVSAVAVRTQMFCKFPDRGPWPPRR